ncbi:MAG: Bax inhibitor-1/YccA family protein [Rhodospirillales bacterium]|jgi:hypothetical protein|nr:Bax inhibitor-1/YccA family protein [Rhodospirillales bacterium]
MVSDPNSRFTLSTQAATAAHAGVDANIDVGLREYMLKVYNYMSLGVALTGIVAMLVAMNPDVMMAIAVGPFKWALFIGILGLGFMAPKIIMTGSSATAQASFWGYAALWGALISPMFFVYTQESIARVFFITAAAFAAMSLYGYTTKRDLAPIGKFLMMSTFGILIAVLANAFIFESSGFHFLLSVVVVVVFAALTAYETQAIKNAYYGGDSGEVTNRKAIFGAFLLYGSFVTMFIWLMQLFGVARE